ncbi:MAG: hypothetical protein ACAI35_03325, partial [Candidatus Methylacidiphilales bacterium]
MTRDTPLDPEVSSPLAVAAEAERERSTPGTRGGRGWLAWMGRWEIMVPLLALIVPALAVGGWWMFGVASVWSYNAYMAKKRAQGFVFTFEGLRELDRRDWRAARDASPVLRSAVNRLSVYGAHVARMRPETGKSMQFRKPQEEGSWADITSWKSGLSGTYAQPSLNEQVKILLLFEKVNPLPAMQVTCNRPDNGNMSGFYARFITLGHKKRGGNPSQREQVAECSRTWRDRMQGEHDRLMAQYLRYALFLEGNFNQRTMEMLSWSLHVHRCGLILLGRADSVAASWEDTYGVTPGINAGSIDTDDLLKEEMYLMAFAVRSGLLKEEHLRRLQTVPFPGAENFRDIAHRHLLAWPVMNSARLRTARSPYRFYRVPNVRGLRVLSPFYTYSGGLEWNALKEVLPRQAELMKTRALLEEEEKMNARLEAQRGTQDWPEVPDPHRVFWLSPYYSSDTHYYWDMQLENICAANLIQGILAFGLYRAQQGKLPATLQDFMTPEVQARLVRMPYAALTYEVDAEGAAKLKYEVDNSTAPAHYGMQYIPSAVITLYAPEDTMLQFPLTPPPVDDEK